MVKWIRNSVGFPMKLSYSLAISDRPTLQLILSQFTSLLKKCTYLLKDGNLTLQDAKLYMDIYLNMVSVLMALIEVQFTVLQCSLIAQTILATSTLKTLELKVNKPGYGHISMEKSLLIREKSVILLIL
jgi:hypothetical protein